MILQKNVEFIAGENVCWSECYHESIDYFNLHYLSQI